VQREPRVSGRRFGQPLVQSWFPFHVRYAVAVAALDFCHAILSRMNILRRKDYISESVHQHHQADVQAFTIGTAPIRNLSRDTALREGARGGEPMPIADLHKRNLAREIADRVHGSGL
jgi:hypothetical protein